MRKHAKGNKTINTKVGLELPMSEQVGQRQVPLIEGKFQGGVRFQVWKRDAFSVFCHVSIVSKCDVSIPK